MITQNVEHGSSDGPRDDPRRAEIEERLVSLDLARFVAKLGPDERDPRDPLPSLQEVFGPHLESALERGLADVPSEVIDLLLKTPSLLIVLQGAVLVSGSEYWTSRIDLAAEGLPPRAKTFLADLEREYEEKLRDEGNS